MTTRKKRTTKPTRKRKTRTRKASKPKTSLLRRIAVPVIALLVLTAAALAAIYLLPWNTGMRRGTIESVLIGAGVSPGDDINARRGEHGTLHWKVTTDGSDQCARIEQAMDQLAASQGYNWTLLEEKTVDGVQNRLFAIANGLGEQKHRLLLVIPKRRPRPKPAESKPVEPAGDFISQNTLDPQHAPQLAIIIDDVGGQTHTQLQPLLDLNMPITFAVLPFLSHSTTIATYLHQHNYEVMLHMPMEPSNYPASNPGPGAVLSHMNAAEIGESVVGALRNVPFVSGINNHMGSKITANRALMREILQQVKARDLFFIDSRTHKSTVAYEMAQEMGIRSGERKVFLDSDESLEFTIGQIKDAAMKAEELGSVIVIGHPYETTIQALVEWLPRLDREGYDFVFASEVVRDPQSAL